MGPRRPKLSWRFGRRSSRSTSCSKNSQLTWTPSPTTTPSSPKRTVDGVPSSKSRLRLARVSPLVSNDLVAPNQPIGLLPLRIDFGIACEGGITERNAARLYESTQNHCHCNTQEQYRCI